MGVGAQCRGFIPLKGKIYMHFLDFGRLIEPAPNMSLSPCGNSSMSLVSWLDVQYG